MFQRAASSVCLRTCCLRGDCGKAYFTSRMRRGGRSLQKINGWLVFLTFARWSLPLLHFRLHKSKSRTSRLCLALRCHPSTCLLFYFTLFLGLYLCFFFLLYIALAHTYIYTRVSVYADIQSYLFQNVPLSRSSILFKHPGSDIRWIKALCFAKQVNTISVLWARDVFNL